MNAPTFDSSASASGAGADAPDRAGLAVTGLTVTTAAGAPIVEDVSLSLKPGRVLGLVGESGSGKTTAALALLGYARGGARITSGTMTVAGHEVDLRGERASRVIRGRHVSYVPQNPGTSLNPSLRIGDAIADIVARHRPDLDSVETVSAGLASVGLPGTADYRRRYPHQLSGGQQQRVCIAEATVCGASVVVLDEPTTGLDVITQRRILQRLDELCVEQNVAMLYITHDLAVVAEVAHDIAVMYAGRVVEHAPAATVLTSPAHPYTGGLLACVPDHRTRRGIAAMPGVAVGIGERPEGCAYAERCSFAVDACRVAMPELERAGLEHETRCIRWQTVRAAPDAAPEGPAGAPAPAGAVAARPPLLTVQNIVAEHKSRRETVTAASNISFAIPRGSCVALVGESGSGKTTIARAIAGLHPLRSGEIRLGDEVLAGTARRRSVQQRRRIRIVFQNPAEALNPRHTAGETIARTARVLRDLSAAAARDEVKRMLDAVRLPQRMADRYPGELSGGEQQRVCIARALVAQPELLICDEVTSALDVSVQAAILGLLGDLRQDLGLSMLFITHDIGVVSVIANEVLVLERGEICERGPVDAVFAAPTADYTKALLEAVPSVVTGSAATEPGAGDAGARPVAAVEQPIGDPHGRK